MSHIWGGRYLDVGDAPQLLLQFLSIVLVAKGLGDFFEAWPGVASMDGASWRMGCQHLLLGAEVEESLRHVKGLLDST